MTKSLRLLRCNCRLLLLYITSFSLYYNLLPVCDCPVGTPQLESFAGGGVSYGKLSAKGFGYRDY